MTTTFNAQTVADSFRFGDRTVLTQITTFEEFEAVIEAMAPGVNPEFTAEQCDAFFQDLCEEFPEFHEEL